MPVQVPSDSAKSFYRDATQTTIEGRDVSQMHQLHMANSFSILLVGGTTAGLTLWANNSNPTLDDRRFPETAYLQVGSDMSTTGLGIVYNLPFSSNWVNITTAPNVTVSASGFFGSDSAFRYIRLQGAALTASVVGYMWDTDSVSHG